MLLRPIYIFACLISFSILCVISISFQRDEFDKRRAALRSYVHDTKYGKQKDNLRVDFVKFLSVRAACPARSATAPSLLTASPEDVLRFLHHRDKNGRTQVHVFECVNFGASGLHECGCPRHFAAGTINSYVDMLRAIFNVGRWFAENPCDDSEVKGWVKAYAKEQQRHRVPIKQAHPTFSTHLRLLVKEIMFRLASLPADEPFFPSRFLLLRDWAFFLVQWFSGDRAGDLGRALTKEVVRLEDGSLLFHHTVGKTIRSASGTLLVVPKVEGDETLCPVEAFDRYTKACAAAGVNLREGYLFPPTALPRHLSIKKGTPLSSTAATKRLRLYLPEEDLTAHGSRAGAAITLLMLGATKEAVMEHCRWATAEVCRHYTKLERVRRLDKSARVLQSGVVESEGISECDSAAFLYSLLNEGQQEPAV